MKRFLFVIFLIGSCVVFAIPSAIATQQHGGREGIYVHQMSHIFFLLSMGILIFWLRMRHLVENIGWRYIQYSAVFFMLWNLEAFCVHFLDEQFMLVRIEKIGLWYMKINESIGWVEIFYYLAKLDHILCVIAMYLLFKGLKQLLNEYKKDNSMEVQP